MRDPITTRALKLALVNDPHCRVLLGSATTYRHAWLVIMGNFAKPPMAAAILRREMRAQACQAVAHARSRLPFYRQCVPHPEALAA